MRTYWIRFKQDPVFQVKVTADELVMDNGYARFFNEGNCVLLVNKAEVAYMIYSVDGVKPETVSYVLGSK